MNTCQHCGQETRNPKYCGLSCQMKQRNIQRSQKLRSEYYDNPKYCAKCVTILDYQHKNNKFCSKSCATSNNNSGQLRKSHKTKLSNCSSCGIKIEINIRASKKQVKCSDCRIKVKEPHCKVEFLTCHITGKPYCSKTRFGGNRQLSPYVRTEREKYSELAKFRFDVYDYPDKFNLDVIEKYGWYDSIKNPNGVSRDHKVSIIEGFMNNYDPRKLAHPANCELILQSQNAKKNSKSSITYDRLLEDIERWD